jgi:hypothetical protein
VNHVLRECLDLYCIAYFDDIVVYSDTREEHTAHVRLVPERLKAAGLFMKLSKCQFYAKRIGFVGFIITPDGVEMEPDRIRTISDWPAPQSHRDIQVFLGFANFYRRFIRNFLKIAKPMSDMPKGCKNGKFTAVFRLTSEMLSAFKQLQEAFTKVPVLIHFDSSKPIRLETDSSGFAISGIISQQSEANRKLSDESSETGGGKTPLFDWHPVAFWSRSMTAAERNYTVGDQEMLAIVMLCWHWRHYLEGARYPVTVLTDHHNLQRFMTTKALTGRQARWWETLSGYDPDIVYRAGKINPADAPSRRPDYLLGSTLQLFLGRNPVLPCDGSALDGTQYSPRELHQQRVFRNLVATAVQLDYPFDVNPLDTFRELVGNAQREDPLAREVRPVLVLPGGSPDGSQRFQGEAKKQFCESWSQYSDGLLYHKELLYVPQAGGARKEVIRLHHDHPTADHFSDKRTLNLLARKYYWPGMPRDIKEYCATCAECQQIMVPTHKKYGKLQSLPTPTELWTDIAIDFITGLPPSSRREGGQKYDAIMVVVDRYTKSVRYYPVTSDITAPHLADLIARKLVLQGAGFLSSIVTDRGTQFTSKFRAALCFHLRIKRRLRTTYHPQTDGQMERQNRTLEQYLRAYVNYQQDDWVYWLPMAEFAYNNSVHSEQGVSPFFAETGRNPCVDDTARPLSESRLVPNTPAALD